MNSLLQSQNGKSSTPTPEALSSNTGSALATDFDRNGCGRITAGCFLGTTATPAVAPRTAGAISPEARSTSDAWAAASAADATTRDRHNSNRHFDENAATNIDGSGTKDSPAVKRRKPPTLGLVDMQEGDPGISFTDLEHDDKNGVPETTIVSPSFRSEKPPPYKYSTEGSPPLISNGRRGSEIKMPKDYELRASPVIREDVISTTLRVPSRAISGSILQSSSKDTGHMTNFQFTGPISFPMKKDAFSDKSTTIVQIPAWNRCGPPPSSYKQPRLQQQQEEAGEEDTIPRLKADGREHPTTTGSHATSDKPFLTRQLDGIMAAYSSTQRVIPVPPTGAATSSRKGTVVAKKRGAKQGRGGGGSGGAQGNNVRQARSDARVGEGVSVALDATGAGSRTVGWRQTGSSSAVVAAAAKTAERTRQLEALMNAAMESPITYEEQVRRERLAHLRVMYTVEKEMAELPVDFLRAVGYEDHGIKPRLSRMCAALVKSHRWSKAVALSRWARVLEKSRAEAFAEEMRRYEHVRLFATLSSVRERWELKQTKRRFSWWRRRVRLARLAKDQDRAREASIKIQRWTQKQLGSRRRQRALERRNRRKSAMARHKADAVLSLISFEDDRRETLSRTLRLMDEKRRYEAIHRAATELQDAWLRHVGRCQILAYADAERQELLRRRLAEQARRWDIILPMAQDFLSSCLDRSQRAVLAKLRAEAEILRLVYEAELVEHRRVLHAAHAVVAHAWRGKRVRLEFLRTTAALSSVQRAWRRAVARRKLQAEIDVRVAATAERIRLARANAAVKLQVFAINRARRHQLNKRFAARKAKLDFERRNRSELASACLVMFKPSRAIREAAGREDFEAMGQAVMPAAAVARLRASAAARGVSLSEMSATAVTMEDDGSGGGGEDEETIMKRLSGSELARAVIKQQEAQRRAAEVLQTVWKKRKAMLHLAGLFEKRKVKLTNEKRERTAFRLQRMWAGAKLRGELAFRVERTRIRIEAERDWGARKLQRLCRCRKDAKELASRFVVRKIILEQARSLREMMTAATKIQLWYRRRQAIYYNTLRVVARYQLAYKRAVSAEEEYLRRRKEAAIVVQLAWRKRSMRVYLCQRFEGRRARLALEKQAAANEAAARVLQGWWRRRQARLMLRGRFAKRARLMMKKVEEEARAALEDKSARLLQKTWLRHCEWEKMRLRFCLRRKVLDETFALEESKRLELEYMANEQREQERRLQLEHEATKVKLLLEEAEKKRKAEEAKEYLLKAWKLGYDKDNARNYWFNHVTGESSLERPEGWVILPSERWKKQTNDKGLVFYLDLETGESHWFPPCEQCYKREGEKVCLGCDGQIYCGRCWNLEHKEEDMAGHEWKGADSGKEDLSPGERHCVDCGFRKAKWVCLQCKDPLCGECNARIHGSGHRKNHQVESYVRSKKGWQTVEGRTDNEPTYYFNATTSESTFDKPQELMLPEELMEHKRFLEYKETSEKYVKKIEKLQFQLEELMYEKDKIAYQWANAQKAMNVPGGEATGTGGLSLGGLKFGGAGAGKKGQKSAATKDPRTREQEEAYKKSLLISRKDKKDMGFEVKLKKEVVLDS